MSAIERQISPEITGEERAVIAQMMKTLDINITQWKTHPSYISSDILL